MICTNPDLIVHRGSSKEYCAGTIAAIFEKLGGTVVYFGKPYPEIYNFLRSSLRSVDPDIPVFMRATGNPGNVGSLWVKEMFVDPSEPNKAFQVHIDTIAGRKSITRRFIPAKLQDNPYLMQTDDYLIMLSSLPEVQRKQFLEGDWGAFENSAFPEFSIPTHVV